MAHPGTSLVGQWIRIRMPMQGTGVRSLVQEDPHTSEQLSLWATTPEAHVPRARAPQQEKPLQWEAAHHNKKAAPARRN